MALQPKFEESHVDVILSFLRHHLKESGRKGFVLGMSGGVDSTLVAKLCADAIGPSRVLGLALPEESGGEDERDARDWAGELGIGFRVITIGSMVDAIARNLKIVRADRIGLGNVKARTRMISLYNVAHGEGGLVVGTGNKSEIATGYFCYDAFTRVLTPEGPKYYWEVKPGTIVFSMGLDTGRLCERPVESTQVFDYSGDMIGIRNRRLDLLVTPNHRILLARNHGHGPLGFDLAEDRFHGGATAIPTPSPWRGLLEAPAVIETSKFLGLSRLSPNANSPVEMLTEDFLYLMGLHIGDGCVSTDRITHRTYGHSYAERLHLRDRAGRLTGFHGLPMVPKTYLAPRMFIAAGEGSRARAPLLALLERNGINPVETPTMVGFTNRALTAAFQGCGIGARNKRIPSWVLKLPAKNLRYLFRGLMDSDGNANGYAYTTISETLAFQVVELCSKLGLHAWVKRRSGRTTHYKGKEIRNSGWFEVRISRVSRTLVFTPANMTRVPYRGLVWCPSVPPHDNVLVERHGKVAFCGNSKFGDAGCDFLPVGDLYKTQVRGMARHLGVPRRILEKVPTAGLWSGQTDEGELGIAYEDLDRILLGIELQYSPAEIAERTGLAVESAERIERLVQANAHKRKMPLIPKVGIRTFGLDWRE